MRVMPMMSNEETERLRRLWVGTLLQAAGSVQSAQVVEDFPRIVEQLTVLMVVIREVMDAQAESIGTKLKWVRMVGDDDE